MGETQSIDSSLTLILLGVIGMLLLAVAVIVFFIVYQKRLFAQQNKIIALETAHQKDLLESSIQAQEVERKRVATDLHDGIGSLLSAIRLYVLQLSPEKQRDNYDELLQETKSMVDSAITQTREISHNLLPTTLDRFGVIQAIEDHCNRMQKLEDTEVTFSYDKEYRFTKQQDLALYRIFQELMNNTIKHAQASQIQVGFHSQSEKIQFNYQDNGKGLPQNNGQKTGSGLGLKSIESRVNLLNGKMDIISAKDKGFQFEMTIPRPLPVDK